jgi:DNA-binding CsgD family transcriptional regulator/PAS domain-containing protein
VPGLFCAGGGMPDVTQDQLLRLIGHIYDAALEPARWKDFVDDLAGICSGTAAITTQYSLGTEARISASSGLDPSFARSYESYYCSTRPWARDVDRMITGEIFTPGMRLGQGEYERSEYFSDWLRPQGIYHLSSCLVERQGQGTTFLTLSRSRRAGEFTTAEFLFTRELVPHLQRALQMHRRLFAVTRQRDLLAHGLGGLGIGAILVDVDARIGYANPIAESFLRRGDSLIARQGRLRAVTQAATHLLHRMIRGAALTGASLTQASGGVVALSRANGSFFHALVCPFPMSKCESLGQLMPCALVFIGDASRNVILRPADLQKLYGLTRAEAELMSALASGQTLDEYARRARIRHTTAKTHLRHIFTKTGWHRQSDIVRGALGNVIAQIAASQT